MSSPLGAQPRWPMFFGDGFTAAWAGWFSVLQNIAFAASSSGTTIQRPTKNLFLGQPYFDTTLNKPIWVSAISPAIVWVDATGAVV